MFYQLIRQLLFKLPAEMAHTFTLQLLKWFAPLICVHAQSSAPQKLWEMNFANPVGLAAGLDKNGDYIIPLARLGFGFIEIGTVTPRPQPGNPKPRLFRLPAAQALINRMGFNNKGVDYLVARVKQANFQGILGINIGKNFDTDINDAINDYLICLEKVYPYASYITINISSPNTPGLRALQYGDYLAELLAQLKEKQLQLQQQYHKYTPLLLKIAPDLQATEIKEIAELLLQYKMDGVIATNTTLDKTLVENLPCGAEQGGLSGQPLTDQATRVVQHLYETLQGQIPIIAAGGIMSAKDAMEKIQAGANLVQIYTGFIYRGPRLIREITKAFTVTV